MFEPRSKLFRFAFPCLFDGDLEVSKFKKYLIRFPKKAIESKTLCSSIFPMKRCAMPYP